MTAVTKAPAVRLTRTIPAPPDRVYRAWLDPAVIRQWFAPGEFAVSDATVDERVGGRHSVRHVDPDGHDVGGFESELVELVPDRRIVFRWGFVGPDHVPDPAHASVLTIDLAPAPGGGTELTLVHERLDGIHGARPEVAAGVSGGWDQALAKLTRLVAS
jgi:uncharacterized protein YndB with AHSA1/START domain